MSRPVLITETGEWISVDPTSNHWLVTGQTGSGKSVTSYLLACIAAAHSRCQVVGVDPSGILGQPFYRVHPNDWVLNSEDMGNNAIDLLEDICREMDRRNRAIGRLDLDKIPDHLLGEGLYAIRVVLEEYAGLLSSVDKKQRDRITTLVGRILREGRKARINVMTILQRPEAALLHDRAQYQEMFLHLLDSKTSVDMVIPDADKDTVKMMTTLATGEGGYKKSGPNGVVKFRTPFMEFDKYSARVRAFVTTSPAFRKDVSNV